MKATSAYLLTDLRKCTYSEYFSQKHLLNLINVFTGGYTRIVGTNLLVKLK